MNKFDWEEEDVEIQAEGAEEHTSNINHYNTLLRDKYRLYELKNRQKLALNTPFYDYAKLLGEKLSYVSVGSVHIPVPLGTKPRQGIKDAFEWWKKNKTYDEDIHNAFISFPDGYFFVISLHF